MIELTPEQQRAVDEANGSPPVVIDRRTQETYRLIRAEVFEKLKQVAPAVPVPEPLVGCPELSEGTRRSLAALRRDLPKLLANGRHRGKYVCYHLEECIGIDRDDLPLRRKCIQQRIPDDEWIVMTIEPGAGEEEIEL